MNTRSSSPGSTSGSRKPRARKQPQQEQQQRDQPSASARGGGEADVQGEGNYDATRRYDQSAREFVQSGQVEDAARAAQPRDEREAGELRHAEDVGRSHARNDANDRMDDSDEESRQREGSSRS